MAIVKTISYFREFYDAIYDSRKKQFSQTGWQHLYDYLEELSDDTGEPVEFDCVAWCCEYTEYTSIDEFMKDHTLSILDTDQESWDDMDDDDKLEIIREYLESETSVIVCDDDCIMYASF